MAREQHLGATDDWFIGEDKTIPFEIYSSDEATMQNITGWALAFYIRQRDGSDKKLLTKTTVSGITIAGSYNADQSTNTQRATVSIDDTDTDHWQPGGYSYALWRTDASNETVLAYGTLHLKKATQ
jgi:phenylpyruvate tautomerase PptA (4-oxalocrotonate tautomerase family)